MTNTTPCPVEGCPKSAYRKGYCYAHYMKNWRYGTPTPNHPKRWQDIAGNRYGSLVAVERVGHRWRCQCDCGNETHVTPGSLNTGQTRSCGDIRAHRWKDDIGYFSAHSRVYAQLGAASEHTCVDCKKQARHWSYNHQGNDELTEVIEGKYLVAYSTDPAQYEARCVPCHKRFDLDRKNATFSVP